MTPPAVRETRSQRLRARRIRVEDLKLGDVAATGLHASFGILNASVEDLSLHGMALVIPGGTARAQMVMGGDRLEKLTVQCTGGVLFEGSAIVRRVTERGPNLIVGVELDSEGIDLGELYRRGTRQGFAERWQGAQQVARYPAIAPPFKAWVADLRSYLEGTRDFLAGEERAIETEDLQKKRQTLQQYLDEVAPHLVARMNTAGAELATHVQGLREEQHAAYRAFCRGHLAPLFAHSPFMRRAYDKPLGYAGDYEMMNMLYREHAEGETLFGRALNVWATQEGAARANINRIDYLGEKIRSCIAHSDRARVGVASIGCGPAREIATLLERSPELGPRLDVALIDQEERSIEYCERTLAPLARRTGARVKFIRESIRRLLTAQRLSRTLGERELIYSAGLFDYLNDRSFGALLRALYDALVPRGLLAIGNVALHNPSRYAMEYFSDWFLIHRAPDALRALGGSLNPAPSSVVVDAEALGINYFVLIRR
ncbi:MAG: class I SAM-dependent methyltransferase [Myxococcales bacterium]|nr:class I SAM-dependent methyltransferase [Myxococcales bacterium]